MKKILSLMCAAGLVVVLSAGAHAPLAIKAKAAYERGDVPVPMVQFQLPRDNDLVAAIETSAGTIRVVLLEDYAPIAVANFRQLAAEGYYNGTIFHRTVKDAIVQGGDPTGTGSGGESAFGTPFKTEAREGVRHFSGALCMAGAGGQLNTHQSQFYFVATPPDNIREEAVEILRAGDFPVDETVINGYHYAGGLPYLDNTDTVFGQVIEGMEVVDAIAGVETNPNGKPLEDITILSIEIERYYAPATEGEPPPEEPPADEGEAPEDTGGEE